MQQPFRAEIKQCLFILKTTIQFFSQRGIIYTNNFKKMVASKNQEKKIS